MIQRTQSLDTCANDLVTVMHGIRTMQARGPVQSAAQKAWLSLDLTMAQMKALMALLHHGGLTSRSVAKRLDVGPSAVTPLVDKLVQQKLVRREPDPTDRRVTWLRPTKKAAALHERLLEANREGVKALLEDVSAADLESVRRGLAVLAGIARARNEASSDTSNGAR